MEPSRIVDVIHDGADTAELVLLRVAELAALVDSDRPRRLIEMAQAELAEAVTRAADVWAAQDPGLADLAAGSADIEVRAAWADFKALLAVCAECSAEASTVIAGRLAVAEDVISLLGVHREYGRGAAVSGRSVVPFPRKALLA